MSPGLILVVGVGRSGTSLLQSMLGSHSAVTFPPETGYLRRYLPHRTIERVARSGGMDAVRAVLQDDPNLHRLPFGIDALLSSWPQEGPVTDASMYDRIRELMAETTGKPRVGDKDPRLIEYLPLVKAHWPDAFVLHIIRDPRDVLLSKKKAAWSHGHPVARHVFANRVQLQIGRRAGPALFGDRYIEIIYEQLIADPAAILSLICDRLGLAFEPAMLEFSQAARLLVSAEELPWKKETLGPLLSTNSGQWQSQLKPWESRLTELACREAMQVGGYESAPPGRAPGWAGRVKALTQYTPMVPLSPAYRAFRHWSLRSGLEAPQ